MTDERPVRVALYGRNSQPPQDWKETHPGEEPPGSWSVQLAALRAWADRQGYSVAYEDHDVTSGGNPNRPGWKRTMAEARGHHFHTIAVVKVDRAMRSVGHFYIVVKELTELGVDLVAIDQGVRISKNDPTSKLLLGVLALIAEFERDLVRERTNAVMRRGPDGRVYGPRSPRPSGRPHEYPEGHAFRVRGGHRVHDKARCRACGERGGTPVMEAQGP